MKGLADHYTADTVLALCSPSGFEPVCLILTAMAVLKLMLVLVTLLSGSSSGVCSLLCCKHELEHTHGCQYQAQVCSVLTSMQQ